jgi:hypothetical protein
MAQGSFERIVFLMLRIQRTAHLEAEFITSSISSASNVRSAGYAQVGRFEPALSALSAASLNSSFLRYETAIENKRSRAINQLERLQRIRKGEVVPAPESVDVATHIT